MHPRFIGTRGARASRGLLPRGRAVKSRDGDADQIILVLFVIEGMAVAAAAAMTLMISVRLTMVRGSPDDAGAGEQLLHVGDRAMRQQHAADAELKAGSRMPVVTT